MPELAAARFRYREADHLDTAAMAALRTQEWGDLVYWSERIGGYLRRELHPTQALPPRVAYVAVHGEEVIGFVAGHLTRRYGCEGEVQWLNVAPPCRRHGVGSALLRLAGHWFAEQHAGRICVDCDPTNAVARAFYARHHAQPLNPHWLVWEEPRQMLRR